jgi:serine phosphatase RsbU (regulator of sigma subunit)
LLTMPFPIFTTLPIESVRVFKWSFFVKYHFATPGPAYSFYGIFVLAIYLPALIIYNRGQVSRFERVIIFFIIIPVIITSINDFAVTHHLIKNIMLTEFSILFTIFAVLLKLYREEQINHIKLELLSEKLQKEVEERTKEISNKNQLIMDSIAYSRKIQKNILPSLDKVGEYFHDYLLIWRQKDIVGGDLFWVNTTEKCLFWAVIDCTGHGVPGALMTFMVKTELNSILQNVLIDEPADILKHLNTELKNLLNQEGLGKEIASSGLDLTVCGHRRGSEYVKIASANQHYWLQGAGGTKVVRGDRMSLGYPDSPADYPFTTTEVNIRDYNRIFCMTDGYYTQLGEASTYQFGRKRVTQMIEENYRTPLHELFDFFKEEYDTYRNTTPQTDDITVFAVDMASYLK